MTKYPVGHQSEIKVGAMTKALAGRARVIVTRLPSGEIKAFASRCPHQGADFENGCISGFNQSDKVNTLAVERAGEIVRCPWHGFEFCMTSGKPTVEPPERTQMKLRFYPVEVEGEQVFVVA